jgi:hypothetical protein
VREVAREAMGSSPQRFDSLPAARDELLRRLRTPASLWIGRASLLRAPAQRRLDDF